MNPAFKHYDLTLVCPNFASPLTDLIIELNYLRKKKLAGSTPHGIFLQLKRIFHILESIGSARIEGNNTTIAEYIETKIVEAPSSNPGINEILNMEQAMEFIDNDVKKANLSRIFISELHKRVVEGLIPPPNGEGDHTPGTYRTKSVNISKSTHKPPEPIQIDGYMDELFAFINKKDEPKYDLLKVAIAHHRFLWIHPFANGNGRTVRLFTYAMLVKQGFFNEVQERILNPTAVFCNNREKYYLYLSKADTGESDGILSWCEYVLEGLRYEIEKIDRLLDYAYLKDEILLPAINYSQERTLVTDIEAKIMKKAIEKKELRAHDLKDIFSNKAPSEVSRYIGKLRDKEMLKPITEGARKYIIRFDNNFLLRGIIQQLGVKGFLPIN